MIQLTKPSTQWEQSSTRLGGPLAALVLACAAPGALAQSAAPATYDPAFVQQMLKRLDAQDAEIKRLKSELARNGDAAGSAESAKAEAFPRLSFHGFGNIDFTARNAQDNTGKRSVKDTFTLGQLDFFLTSRINESMSILSEVVMEAGSDNKMGIDLERLLFQWRFNDYFNMDVGRYHTVVGYYNTAYHHGTWFQTAVGRPTMLDFEDGGGIIPAHNVGVHFHGDIPSGSVGLGYILEVGNGRAYNEADPGTVQNVGDVDKYKAVNLAFIARPEAIPGLQVGAGVYHDTLLPISNTTAAAGTPFLNAVGRTDELMFHAHAVYKHGPWEYLSEGYLVRHKSAGDVAHLTPAGFAQLAYKIDSLTPYTRFSYVHALNADRAWPFVGAAGLHYGPGVGLRWDFSTLAAFKVQYDLIHNSLAPDAAFYTLNGGTLTTVKGWDSMFTAQIAFTF